MNNASRRITASVLALGLVAGSTALGVSAQQPKFLADDPVWIEDDSVDVGQMRPFEPSLFVDITYNLLANRKLQPGGRAGNINTVDEVPDSNWYTNRLGARTITVDDITRGPNTDDGPAPGPWTITSSKSDGVTPGFTIKDANGQRWFLKFDPPGYRGMATGTEVAVTKLMWALGYNVPENHIAQFRRDQLVVGDLARVALPSGKRRAMRDADVDRLLERAERNPDGSYRVVASKALAGIPVGRIRFEQTRPDDPNDLVPHEDRRELRGYGVFAAWLNHVDAKSINSLDTLVGDAQGRRIVRHHLIDFGSALGSGGVNPADRFAGSGYVLDPGSVGKQIAGFGFAIPEYRKADYYEASSIGRVRRDNSTFDPDAWKPSVPNPAFLRARDDDKFWAARKLAAMSTELIRAAVKAGQFGDPTSEAFLVSALAERRDVILHAYLPSVTPIVNPMLLSDGTLAFENAAVEADVARAPREYRARWSRFDNATGMSTTIGVSSGGTALSAPQALPEQPGTFVKVSISAAGGPTAWETPVDIYFRNVSGAWQVVGLEYLAN